ncbi:TIGR01777 family oxidoreductase [Aureitalea marina]|uniref:TIGR01777 family protein n=1 Tax=Aureitalea marina TaxID=930804 RepID=A0A2S7KML8_9FLAO|nr:TIGR01777 family oxidoreductase [Aureitalea marina]PQB03830.1 TIGR01777 family protein [Aureitalea marina]
MKVLIAGATGLIGQELVRQCLEKEIAVNYLTTRKDKIIHRENYNGYHWSPDHGEMDLDALKGVTVVINLAGATVAKRWNKSYKEQVLNSRIQTAQVIFNGLSSIEHRVQHYIGASGISYYPDSDKERYKEDFEQHSPSFLGRVTRDWEAAALAMEKLGVKVGLVRTGLVMDMQAGALPQMVGPIRKGLGAPLGRGTQWQSWIHIKDIAAIYLFMAENGLTGIYNGVAPNPVTNKALTLKIAQVIGKKIILPPVPAFMLRLMLGEMADLVLEGQWVSCEKIRQAGYVFQYDHVDLALDDLLG